MITMEDMWKEIKKGKEKERETRREINRLYIKELQEKGLTPLINEDGERLVPPEKPKYDHPNTMENSTATILWLAVMIGGAIFKDNWMIWIAATAIWFKFITRHKK